MTMDPVQIAVLAGLVIGLVYGSIGLLSGFCMMSGLRGWWAEGDSRLARTYALAIGIAIAASQLLALVLVLFAVFFKWLVILGLIVFAVLGLAFLFYDRR